MLAPLRAAPFRRYLTGQLPSVTCSWAQVVALSWVVVSRDPGALGTVVALQFLPSLVLGPWLGAVADRYDRRRLLMAAEAFLGLVATAYAVAAATGRLGLPLVFALATAWGIGNALDTPARQALIPALVPPADRAGAAALSGTAMLVGMTLGSSLGGLLVATAGAAAAFAVNAASFVFDVTVLATVRVPPSPRTPRAPRQVRDGLGYVWRSAQLRNPLLVLAAIAALAFNIPVAAPILARIAFGGGAGLVSAAFTVTAAGSLAAAVISAIRPAPHLRRIHQAATAMAIGAATTALATDVQIALVGLAGIAFGWSLLIAAVVGMLQTGESRMLGRIMSLFAVVLLGGNTVGGPVAAALATAFGPRGPFVVAAVTAATTALLTQVRRGQAGIAADHPTLARVRLPSGDTGH
jgi:MFS family permease